MKKVFNSRGAAEPFILVCIFAVMCFLAVLLKYNTLFATYRSVKEAMQKTASTANTRNTEETFSGKRDAYGGAWEYDTGAWRPDADQMLPEAQLAAMLVLKHEGADLVKYDANGTELYRLQNVELKILNVDRDDEQDALKSQLTLVLQISFGLPMTDTVTLHIPLTVTAGNSRKY